MADPPKPANETVLPVMTSRVTPDLFDTVDVPSSGSSMTAAARAFSPTNLEATTIPLCLIDANRHILWGNAPFSIFSRAGALPRQFDELLAPGQPLAWPLSPDSPLEVQLVDKAGAPRWHELRILAPAPAPGTNGGTLLLAIDVNDRHDLHEFERAVRLEMVHRMRNLVSIVIALVNDALSHSPTQAAVADLVDRLRSLEAAGYAGDEAFGACCTVAQLIQRVLDRFHDADDPRLTIESGEVMIARHQANMLGLVLHELATNCVKYGAFSSRRGHLHIRCCRMDRDGQPLLHLHWRESGIALDQTRGRSGYGVRFIRRVVDRMQQPTAEFRFLPTGLSCTIEFALDPA